MNEYCKQLKSLGELPNDLYEGYIWISNENSPRRVTKIDELLPFQTNPFIVEGQLKSEDNKTSISIREVGGKQLIYQFDLQALDQLSADQKTEKSLLVHRLEGVEKIKMFLVWLPEKDAACAGMEVLMPEMRVFNGFEFKK